MNFILWLLTQGSMHQDGARGQNLGHLYKVFFYFSIMETMQIVGQTWLSLGTLTCESWSDGQHDLCFTVILPYILKTIWCMYIILWNYELVWSEVWPQNKYSSLWPIFMVQWFCLISWRLFDVCTSLFGIINQYDPTFALKIDEGHCDLYFMVQWFCVISWKTIWCMNIILRDCESVWPDNWPQNKCRSLWPIFHGPAILPYILKTVWCMYIILWDYESVWPEVWPKNKCRSLWPIFYGPLVLPCILKTIWYVNIIIWAYDSVWPDVWPQNKCRSLWPIFHGPVILHFILKIIWCRNIILRDYGSVWPDVWGKINVGHCDLYFMVQWFCLISWRLFDVWTSLFGIMSPYDPKFDLKINVGKWPIFQGPVYALHLEDYLMYEHHTFG